MAQTDRRQDGADYNRTAANAKDFMPPHERGPRPATGRGCRSDGLTPAPATEPEGPASEDFGHGMVDRAAMRQVEFDPLADLRRR